MSSLLAPEAPVSMAAQEHRVVQGIPRRVCALTGGLAEWK